MSLYERIESDARAALKEGKTAKLSVLRMLISAIKVFELEKRSGKVEEQEVLEIIHGQIKQRKESIEQFKKGNRLDLADKETEELGVLEAYMPEQLSDEELVKIIKETISETGAATNRDTGKVMKLVMGKIRGRADGRAVNKLVTGFLK